MQSSPKYSIAQHICRYTLLLFLLPYACNPKPQSYHETLYVFGTLVDIDLPDGLNAESSQALTAIRADFNALHRHLHAWEPGELTDLNRAFSRGDSMRVSPELLHLLQRAKEISVRGQGYFNPAIGQLVALWGFHSDQYPVTGPLPDPAAIAQLLGSQPSMQQIEIDGARITSSNPQVQLDFGGIAKGYALDRGIDLLRRYHVENAMINAGGDLRAIGARHGHAWRVGIRNPFRDSVAYGLILGPDESVMTSGNYYRFHAASGKRYSHIINPRSGYPVDEIVSATVITQGDATLADAAATALSVAGSSHWREVARAMGLDSVLLIDAQGNLFASSKMFQRLLAGEPLMAPETPDSIPGKK